MSRGKRNDDAKNQTTTLAEFAPLADVAAARTESTSSNRTEWARRCAPGARRCGLYHAKRAGCGRDAGGTVKLQGVAMNPAQHSLPPAQNLVVLASDLLAAATKTMLDELAGAGQWPAAQRVRQCLEAYEAARCREIIITAKDPQCMQLNEPAPLTERSTQHG